MNNKTSPKSQYSRYLAPKVVVPVVAVLVLGAIVLTNWAVAAQRSAVKSTTAAQQKQLRQQVDTSSGAPRSGRDPSAQAQTGLSAAASAPSGTGLRTDKPAAGIQGDTSHHATPGHVHGDSSQTGLNSAGCYIGYGVQGEQCLPAHAADENGNLTCAGVRAHFPSGIKVTGTDRYKLDVSRNGIACDSRD